MSRDDLVAVLWLYGTFIFIGCMIGLHMRGSL